MTGPSGRFEAVVVMDPAVPDGYMKHYVALPADLASAFAAAGVGHVTGRIAGAAFRRRIHVRADGTACVRFGRSWLRDAGLAPGDVVAMEVAEDGDPDRVDLPEELAALIDADPVVEHLWVGLTPGRQRTLVYGVARAKRSETRQRRAAAVVADLRAEFGGA